MSCGEQERVALPNTPKEVVKAYQAYYDKNEFQQAKQLSTERGKVQLEEIKKAIANEPPDSTVFTTTFLDMNCEIMVNRAVCKCFVKDNYEDRYTTVYHLVEENGQWLVDAPEEDFEIDSDQMFKNFIDEQQTRQDNDIQ